jgi:hypothetical protein
MTLKNRPRRPRRFDAHGQGGSEDGCLLVEAEGERSKKP